MCLIPPCQEQVPLPEEPEVVPSLHVVAKTEVETMMVNITANKVLNNFIFIPKLC